jgi:hypothetical protein
MDSQEGFSSMELVLTSSEFAKAVAFLLLIRNAPLSSLDGSPIVLVEVFHGLPSRIMPEYYLKLGHDRFLPYPFQFIVH